MPETDARMRLREAALDLFGRRGVAGTTTRDILAAAGVRNSSAVSYHFGSKSGLVDDLVRELTARPPSIVHQQTALGQGPQPPSVEAWAAVPVDRALDLVSTERGCLLARLSWEYDSYLAPWTLEAFLEGGSPRAVAWVEATAATFPRLPRRVAVARNVTALRTVQWMIARLAEIRLREHELDASPLPRMRAWLLEVSISILDSPTHLTDADLELNPGARGGR